MLNLNHPQTQNVFEASRIEDEIRVHLVSWRKLGNGCNLPIAEANAIDEHIARLHALNARCFGAQPGIANTLNALSHAVGLGNLEASWEAFLNLAEKPNCVWQRNG